MRPHTRQSRSARLSEPKGPLHMECHVPSCSVMICMCAAHILWPVRAWSCRSRPVLPVFHSVSSALRLRHGSLLSSPLRSVLPAARLPARRDPDSRVTCARLCRRGRAFRGGAVRAHLIAPAPAHASQTQGTLHLLAESGAFSRRRGGQGGPARRPLSCHRSHTNTVFLKSHHENEIFLISGTRISGYGSSLPPACCFHPESLAGHNDTPAASGYNRATVQAGGHSMSRQAYDPGSDGAQAARRGDVLQRLSEAGPPARGDL